MDRSYNSQTNSNYGNSIDYSTQVPYKKQQSPVISQLVRKDKEIDKLRDEIEDLNIILDRYQNQDQLFSKCQVELDYYRQHSYLLQEQIDQLESKLREADQKVRVNIQQTIPKYQIPIGCELELNHQVQYIQSSVFNDRNMLVELLYDSLSREADLKQMLDNLAYQCRVQSDNIYKQQQEIIKEQIKKDHELFSIIQQSENQRLFYKEKSEYLLDLLTHSAHFNSIYHYITNTQKQLIIQKNSLIVQQQQIIKDIMSCIDTFIAENNLQTFSVIQQNLMMISNCNTSGKVLEQISDIINQSGIGNSGKNVYDKLNNIFKKVKNWQETIKQLEDEREVFYKEMEYYKDKFTEQDNIIQELYEIILKMEVKEKQTLMKEHKLLLKENIQYLNQDQQDQTREEAQKQKVLVHKQSEMHNKYESNTKQNMNTQQLMLNNQVHQQIVPMNETKHNQPKVYSILEYILSIAQGYNHEKQEWHINTQVQELVDQQATIKETKEYIDQPIINSILIKISLKIAHLYQNQCIIYHEMCEGLLTSLRYIQTMIPQKFQLQLIKDSPLKEIEQFFSLSYKHLIDQLPISDAEQSMYFTLYQKMPQYIGQMQEITFRTFVKLIRDSVYTNLIKGNQ